MDHCPGFASAAKVACEITPATRMDYDAYTRPEVFVLETMGRDAGWLTLHAGIGSGADIILIPEIPYDINAILKAVDHRRRHGRSFSILAVAEGAKSIHDQILTEEESRRRREQSKHSTISYEIAAQIEAELGQEARVTVPGHYQRGGPPCPYDRVLATQFGTAAADLIVNKQYGRMVAIQNGHIVSIPLEEAASKTKFLPTDHPLIQVARDIGISFGD